MERRVRSLKALVNIKVILCSMWKLRLLLAISGHILNTFYRQVVHKYSKMLNLRFNQVKLSQA